MTLLYVENVHELSKLVEVKDDNDAMAIARIALWRLMKNVDLFMLHGCNKGNGVVLSVHEGDNVRYKMIILKQMQ